MKIGHPRHDRRTLPAGGVEAAAPRDLDGHGFEVPLPPPHYPKQAGPTYRAWHPLATAAPDIRGFQTKAADGRRPMCLWSTGPGPRYVAQMEVLRTRTHPYFGLGWHTGALDSTDVYE